MKNLIHRSTGGELIVVLLILVAGVFILFWKIFILGYIQVPADILGNDPVFREEMPGFVRANNDLLYDHIYAFYVWHSLAARALQEQHTFPLWNPYIMAGQPLVANAQPALFYPPNWLLFRYSVGAAANARLVFNILVAGLFTFLFARRLRVSLPGALLAALSFAFSGAVMVGPGHAYAGALVWLPVMLWACEGIIQSDRPYFWGSLCGLGIGLSLLAGHPETTAHNLLLLGAYFLARLFQLQASCKSRLNLSLAFCLALVLGFLVGAVQWLPFASFWAQSATPSRSRSWGAANIFYTPQWLPNLATLVTLIFPNFFGNPADGTYFWPFFNYQNYLEQSMYIGLLPSALAVGALFGRRGWRSPVPVLAILGIFSLALALRLPLIELLNALPVMRWINNTRLKWQFTFFGTVLAGFGLDDLITYLSSGRRDLRRVFRAVAVVLGLGLVTLVVIYSLEWIIFPLFNLQPSTSLTHLFVQIFSWKQPRTVVSVAILLFFPLCFIFLFRRRQSWGALPWFVILVTALELTVVSYGYHTTIPRRMLPQSNKLVRQLQKDTGVYRVLTAPRLFGPNIAAVFGFFDVGGYDLPVNRRYGELVLAQGAVAPNHADWSPTWPLVNYMNVRYILSPSPLTLPGLELFVQRPGYFVYKNLNALPRAYLVYDYDVVPDHQTAIQRLLSGAFDFKYRAILEKPLPEQQTERIGKPEVARPADPNAVQIVNFGFNDVSLDVEAPAPALLVMSDVNAPGWQAELDGQAVEIYNTNYAFRGVFIPAGSHRLVFRYRPWEVQAGKWLTLVGVAAALLVLIAGLLIRFLKGNDLEEA